MKRLRLVSAIATCALLVPAGAALASDEVDLSLSYTPPAMDEDSVDSPDAGDVTLIEQLGLCMTKTGDDEACAESLEP